jgi:hypothetical protein
MFGSKKNERKEHFRIVDLHNEELGDLFESPNIIRLVKYRRLRWAGKQGIRIEF